MQTYNEQHIHKAEIAQLILLYHLYAQTGSHELVFQGGTALRWCYNGSRFSEDLDFVTTIASSALEALLAKALKAAEREMVPHFGRGRMTVTDKSTREGSKKLLVTWQTEALREKISIKLETEPLVAGTRLATTQMVMSSLPSVAYLVASGGFRIPRPNSVLVVETAAEILTDKVRALLERQYIKGRDLFDIWLLRHNNATSIDRAMLAQKLKCYAWPFKANYTLDYFLAASSETQILEALEKDLSRFLPAEVMAVHRHNRYHDFLEAVRDLCRELQGAGGLPA